MLATQTKEKEDVCRLLALADIRLDGDREWDIQIHDERFYEKLLYHQNMGLGESYMDAMWDCLSIDEMITRIIQANLEKYVKVSPGVAAKIILAKLLNYQTKRRSKEVARKHYNLGNNLFEAMLDKEMIYSCGYWKEASNLEEAQRHKLDLICKKLQLEPGMKLLDVGCGWGGLAKFAAENYDVEVVGITISEEQKKLAEERCKHLPITFLLQDYRDLDMRFDRIVSVGMFEHVGYKNYRTFMKAANRCLRDDGIFLLHTIGGNQTVFGCDPWIDKYIFPNGVIPSINQIDASIGGLFIMEDWHNFGADYDQTLMAWHHNFNLHWPKLQHEYDERFRRMWNYYLLSCAGGFRARSLQLWQIVLSKTGLKGGYHFRY